MVINILKSFMGIRDFLFVVNNPTLDPNCISFSNNVCLTCRNGLVVQNGTCSACFSGFYLSNSVVNNTLQCLSCPQTCLECSEVNSTVICSACREPLVLTGSFCVDSSNSLFSSEIIPNIALTSQKIAWVNYPNLQNSGIDSCGSSQMIGTSTIKSKFLTMRRQFTSLPAHTGVILYFTFWQIDQNYFPNNNLVFELNGQQYSENNITNIT